MRVWDIHIHDYMHHDGDDDAIKVVDWNSEHSMTSMMNTISLSIDLMNLSIYLSIDQGREEYTCESMDDAVLLKAMHMVIFVIEAKEPHEASITASLAKATAK